MLLGRRVVSFESRRENEMASLIERHGGVAVRAPALREVPVAGELPEVARFMEGLIGGTFEYVVLMTGVGTRALARAVRDPVGGSAPDTPVPDAGALARALGAERPVVVARGPKPAAALRELGVTGFLTVPEPNTWREVLTVLEAHGLRPGVHVAIQEYGAPSHDLESALALRGARVTTVPVYRWALPEDTGPLRAALRAIAAGEIEVALFTSRAQVEHAMLVAREEGLADAVRSRLARGCVASIGPVCSGALALEGISVDLEPAHPKMGHLVKETAERVQGVLDAKRSASA